MTAAPKRNFAWFGALFALSVVLTGCGSSAPARPTALDPSNPGAPESPPTMPSTDAAVAPAATDADMNMDMSADAGAMPVQHEHHHHGAGTPSDKGGK